MRKFQTAEFADEAVIYVTLTTFADVEHEFLVNGVDVNKGNSVRFKRICGENGIGWKTVRELRFQDFSGHHCCYTRKRKNANFIRSTW